MAKECARGMLDLLMEEGPGAAIAYLLGMAWLVVGISLVSDAYFAYSIERIIVEWKISPSVAGATLMAAGSSAPEFIAELVGVLLGEDEASTGTVVGSAIFNQLVIVGASILVSPGQVLVLDPQALARDLLCYGFTIGLITFVFQDGKVHLWEAIVMFLSYVAYVILCASWSTLLSWTKNRSNQQEQADNEVEVTEAPWHHGETEAVDTLVEGSPVGLSSQDEEDPEPAAAEEMSAALEPAAAEAVRLDGTGATSAARRRSSREASGSMQRDSSTSIASQEGSAAFSFQAEEERHTLEVDVHQILSPWERWQDLSGTDFAQLDWRGQVKLGLRWVYFFAELPFALCLHYTLGTLQRRDWFHLVFCGSLIYLLVLVSFLISWLARLGCLVSIKASIMGATLGAAATSMPDFLVSLHVARQGQGTMTVANVLGSNIFDILFALGLPWIIATGFLGKSHIEVGENTVQSVLLIVLFCLFCASLWVFDFIQGKSLGIIYLALYAAFFLFSFLEGELT